MIVLFVFVVLLTRSCHSQLLSVSLNVSHISTGGSRVFAAAGATLYQYSFDLTQQQSKELIGGNIVGLATTPDGEWIIACVTNGGCSVIRSTDLSIVNADTADDNAVYALDAACPGFDGISLFTSPVSNGQSYYIGSYGTKNGGGGTRIRFNQRGFNGSSVTRDSVGLGTKFVGRHFYGGFVLSKFVYFIVIDQVSSGQQLRIVRVCRDYTVQSQYELRLACSTGVFKNVVRGVSVINDETLIIGLTTNNQEKLCSFSISMINSMMDSAYDTCIDMGSGGTNVLWSPITSCSNKNIKDPNSNDNPATECDFNVNIAIPIAIAPSDSLSSTDIPLNDTVLNGLRATIVLAIDSINIVYAAFVDNSEYYLDKYHWSGGSVTLIEEVQIVATSVAEATIIASQDGENIFLTSDNKIVVIPVENCSRADSCEECVGLGDPLCGWCVFEGKCSRSSLCMDSESTGRFLSQGEESDRVTIEPSEYVQDLEEMPYEISVTFVPALNAPKLPGEGLFCVFTNGTTVLMTELTAGGGCSVQVVLDKLTELSVISLSTELSIFSNRTGVKFLTAESPYVFYNCALQTTCAGCVEAAPGICGWCQLDFECTGDSTTCTGGPSNWLTISSDESYTDVCPLLVANNGDVTDYTQPLNVADDLSLITLNTPTITGLTYQCVFVNKLTVPATRISDTNVMCNINSGQLQSNMNTETHDFILRQVYNSEMYSLGTKESVDINVVLYNCMELAESCSQCFGQNINTGFNCNWCSSNGQCTVATQCGSSDRVTVSGECESPMITALDPTTGPPGGETTITIDGTNLGLMFSDIVSVMVGVRTCTSIESQYRSGVRIVCTINGNNVNPVGTVSVIVTVSTSSGNKKAISNLFVISVPMIVSVTPEFGPVSGGTTVTIRGENLDIGHKDNTRILFREISGNRRKRQTCPERECVINESTFNSTFLSCMSTEGDSSDCVMEAVVNINEDEYSNNTVSFLYTPDPVFESVVTNDVIPAGGIQVVFTGTNLNVIQSPTLNIVDSRFTASNWECSSVTGDTLECVFPALTLVSGTISDVLNSLIDYTVIVDGADGPNSGVMAFHLQLRPDPVINEVINNQIDLPLSGTEIIRISGNNLITSLRNDINITVGTFDCPVITIYSSEISCQSPNITNDVELFVIIRIGQNLQFGEENDLWRVSFAGAASQSSSSSTVITASTTTVILLLFILLIAVVFLIIILFVKNAKLSGTSCDTTDTFRFDSENIAVKTSVKMDYQGDTNKTVHSQANHSYSAINDNHLNKELQINNDKEGLDTKDC